MNDSSNPNDGASRRTFLKTSGLALGGVAASELLIVRTAHANLQDETIRVGLIGCGGRGTGAAAQALSTKGPVKLVAMGDAFADRLQGSLDQLNKNTADKSRIDVPEDRRFVGFDAYKQVLAAGVDMVILATPPGFRPVHFAAAVDAGKHVFMEKPVAVDGQGVRQVIDASRRAKEKGLAVGVGLQRRHQNAYIDALKQVQDGAIGDITMLRVYWNGAGVWVRPRQADQTEMEYQMRNWYYHNWLCGDHIVEQHIHNLDVGNWFKDALPVKAQGMGGREVRTGDEYGEIYDHHAVEFEYADGSRMMSFCRHIKGCWNSVSEHAHGTKARMDISGRPTIYGADGKPTWRYSGPNNNPYQTEHDDLFAAIRSGEAAGYNEGEYGANSTMTSILGRLCTYSGKMITWDEALNSKVTLAQTDKLAGIADYTSFDQMPPKPHVAVPGVTRVV
jgi:predicted dehydrogenase